jgi:chorismate mutase
VQCSGWLWLELIGRRDDPMTIEDWRCEIDAIDKELVRLLNLRTELTLKVGQFKSSYGLALRVPAREKAILKRLKELNSGPLDNESLEKIYHVIFDLSVRSQQLNGMGKPADGRGNRARAAARGSQKRPARA